MCEDQTARTNAAARANAGSAAFSAACLIYFGFFRFAIPTVTSLFSLGDAVFNYTLRIGGVAMAGIALWCLIGSSAALLVDGFVSVAVGLLLAFSGVAMLLGGGSAMGQGIYILFGGMFAAAGVRNVRLYRQGTVADAPGEQSV